MLLISSVSNPYKQPCTSMESTVLSSAVRITLAHLLQTGWTYLLLLHHFLSVDDVDAGWQTVEAVAEAHALQGVHAMLLGRNVYGGWCDAGGSLANHHLALYQSSTKCHAVERRTECRTRGLGDCAAVEGEALDVGDASFGAIYRHVGICESKMSLKWGESLYAPLARGIDGAAVNGELGIGRPDCIPIFRRDVQRAGAFDSSPWISNDSGIKSFDVVRPINLYGSPWLG